MTATLARFRRGETGSAAVQFALVVFPFCFTLLASWEVAMLMWTTEALEKAVSSASRKIYTGQFQTDSTNASLTAAQLRTKLQTSICTDISGLVPCSGIDVDVREFGSFSGLTAPNPVTSQKAYDASGYGYSPVGARQIGLVTATVQYRTFFPPLSGGALANGNRLIMATAAFRTEPYAN